MNKREINGIVNAAFEKFCDGHRLGGKAIIVKKREKKIVLDTGCVDLPAILVNSLGRSLKVQPKDITISYMDPTSLALHFHTS